MHSEDNVKTQDEQSPLQTMGMKLKALLCTSAKLKLREQCFESSKKWIALLLCLASGPIISWEIDGERVETVSDFILGGSKITADGDCSHEIKRHVLLGRKVMTNLDSIFKSRDITLTTKVRLVKAMVCPVVMYGCESWTVKVEHWRIDAFELWCWRPLRVPWTERDPTSPFWRRSTLGFLWKEWC